MEYLLLNLQESYKTDINYKINQFPDGQQSITLLEADRLYKKIHVIIVKSIQNFSDFELIMSAVSALKAHTNEYSLYTPYIVGARSDRKFEVGGDFYFRDVIENILKSLNCPIFTIDLHCKSDFNDIKAFSKYIVRNVIYPELKDYRNKTILFPDESAKHRLRGTINFINYPHCTFVKERTCGIIKQVPLTQSDETVLKLGKDFIIIDDLFDGGRSYLGLCEMLRNEMGKTGKITIFVTHFIGSNKEILDKLAELNVEIVTTNSYDRFGKYDFTNGMIKKINVFDADKIKTMINEEMILNDLQRRATNC